MIKEGSFKPAAVTDSAIYNLVRKYRTQEALVQDTQYGPLCLWKTGQVKNMFILFANLQWKDEWDVRLWDTRGVDNMHSAFKSCIGLLTGVEHWNVMSAENMGSMFFGASGFNRDISRWDTSNVKNMGHMFKKALAFNQPIGKWDTRNVTNMESMFRNAAAFNQPIGNWDMTKVKTTLFMYTGATAMQEENKPESTRRIAPP
jgi:surface protein